MPSQSRDEPIDFARLEYSRRSLSTDSPKKNKDSVRKLDTRAEVPGRMGTDSILKVSQELCVHGVYSNLPSLQIDVGHPLWRRLCLIETRSYALMQVTNMLFGVPSMFLDIVQHRPIVLFVCHSRLLSAFTMLNIPSCTCSCVFGTNTPLHLTKRTCVAKETFPQDSHISYSL